MTEKKITARLSEKKEIRISVPSGLDANLFFSSPRTENGHFVFDIFVPTLAVVTFIKKPEPQPLTNNSQS